eukprot:1189008-Prorocentrum_minimum.AAC.1
MDPRGLWGGGWICPPPVESDRTHDRDRLDQGVRYGGLHGDRLCVAPSCWTVVYTRVASFALALTITCSRGSLAHLARHNRLGLDTDTVKLTIKRIKPSCHSRIQSSHQFCTDVGDVLVCPLPFELVPLRRSAVPSGAGSPTDARSSRNQTTACARTPRPHTFSHYSLRANASTAHILTLQPVCERLDRTHSHTTACAR